MLKAEFKPYTLNFAFEAHTSRETFTRKPTYFITVRDTDLPGVTAIGEAAVFPSLQPSFNGFDAFECTLADVCDNIAEFVNGRDLPDNSAIRFGVESALSNFANHPSVFGQAALDNIRNGVRINGLVWMNDAETMQRQIGEKLTQGFKCLKLKIGALDFDSEVGLIRRVREMFGPDELELRLDANGAFRPDNVMQRLDTLAPYHIHSLEQPLPRDSAAMADVCRRSPIPIALDEDMIERFWTAGQMAEWLDRIHPAYIVLKPSLVGGFEIADKWINVADNLGIGWWATSALESNVGLSAIAQWLGTHNGNLDMAHGLGTGQIYTNNIDGYVERRGERIFVI